MFTRRTGNIFVCCTAALLSIQIAGACTEVASQSVCGLPFGSSSLPGHCSVTGAAFGLVGGGIHCFRNINDGRYGNSKSWIPNPYASSKFAGIRFHRPYVIDRIEVSRDNTGYHSDRSVFGQRLEYTTDVNADQQTTNWQEVSTFSRTTSRLTTINFDPVNATAVRLVQASGSGATDEFKVYACVANQSLIVVGPDAGWECTRPCNREEWNDGSSPTCRSCAATLDDEPNTILDVNWEWVLGDEETDACGWQCLPGYSGADCEISCWDGLKNQGESGPDCGGPCDPCPACTGDDCACTEDESDICHVLADCTRIWYDVTIPANVDETVPTSSDGQFTCSCPPGVLGHGFGANGCVSTGWNVRVVYRNRDTALNQPERATLLWLMDYLECYEGSESGCDQVYYTFHDEYSQPHLGVNLLFPDTAAGKLAAEQAVLAFNAASSSSHYPAGVDPSIGARIYAWTAGTTSDQIKVFPAGLVVQRVHFESACAETGCWVLDVDFTVGHSDAKVAGRVLGFNTFFLPYAVGSDALSYDFSYSSSVLDSFEPANFPCRVSDYIGGTLSLEATLCCFGITYESNSSLGGAPGSGLLGNYRPTEAFAAFAAPHGNNSNCSTTMPEAVEPDYATALSFFAKGQKFTNMDASPGVTQVTARDSFVGMYSATIKLDEAELRTQAGLLRGTVGVEHSVDFFLGYANFKPATTTTALDTLATQTAIHVEKTNFFTVSTHGTNDYTFLDYVNMRLVAIYMKDSASLEQTVTGNSTESASAANYVQVTFTLGSKYSINANTGLVPLGSVRTGRGAFFDDALLDHKCLEWTGATGYNFHNKLTFTDRLGQLCAPNAEMCESPDSVQDSFVSFQIPLGLGVFEDPSSTLANNIFVEMVVSVVDTEAQASGGSPNNGDIPWQMKTTLTASIPIVEGGVNLFCDGLTAKTDLKDVAEVDIVVGSASSVEELTRLRIKKDIASTQLSPSAVTPIDSDSIEAGLMTLVLKGNASYFGPQGNSGRAQVTLELEDVITIHIMEDDGNGADSSVSSSVLALFTAAPSDNGDSSGLDTDGYALNGAFIFTIDRSAQRAHLEPSEALLGLCPFNPPRPSAGNGPLETCVSRRDVRYRNFPWRAGAKSTAMEICTEGGGACPCAECTSSDESDFMITILGDNDYAKLLAVNYSNVISETYELNGRYRRAYWINPGYEWTPTQTGGTPIFSVSQKLYMFALITLDEGLAVGDEGNSIGEDPGPSLRRRMLLQSTPEEALLDGQSSLGAEAFEFQTSPMQLMAKAFDVSQEQVAIFLVTMHLTQAEACLAPTALQAALRDTLQDYLSASASAFHTIQVTGLSIDRSGVQCGRRAKRSLLSSWSEASAKVTMLVVFKDGRAPTMSITKLETMPGIDAVEAIAVAPSIDTESVPGQSFVSHADSETGSSSASSSVGIIAAAAGGGAAMLAVGGAVLLLLRSRRQQSEVVNSVTVVDMDNLKCQLQQEV